MEIRDTEVWGFKNALFGMRNPMDSWDKSDSKYWFPNEFMDEVVCGENIEWTPYHIGENDMQLAHDLLRAGSEHSKFMRMIHVSANVDMPRYWWSETDTYHFNTKNSCSTMHKLLNRDTPLTLDLFITCEEDADWWDITIKKLEALRQEYKYIQKTTKDKKLMDRLLVRAKRMLPEGFLQMRTWDTNYAEIRNMCFQRRHHRLKEEWIDTFCKWVETLPYAKQLIMYEGK